MGFNINEEISTRLLLCFTPETLQHMKKSVVNYKKIAAKQVTSATKKYQKRESIIRPKSGVC